MAAAYALRAAGLVGKRTLMRINAFDAALAAATTTLSIAAARAKMVQALGALAWRADRSPVAPYPCALG